MHILDNRIITMQSWFLQLPDQHQKVVSRELTMCGYFCSLTTCTLLSLIFKYWSTECNIPVMARSFFSSTVTSLPTKVLKYE